MSSGAIDNAVQSIERCAVGMTMGWVVLFGIGGIFQPSEGAWGVILSLFSILLVILIALTARWLAFPLVAGFVLRLVFLWLDLFTEVDVFSSGGDTENFYSTALMIYHDPSQLGEDLYGGVFPQLCGVLFGLVGPSRLFVQYTNVVLAILGFVMIGLAMHRLRIPVKICRRVVLVSCLMPIPASLSAIFLRESLIFCLVAISIYSFSCWLETGSIAAWCLALGAVPIAGVFHLGVLGIAVGYGLALLFYDRELGRLRFTAPSIVRGIPIVLIGIMVIVRNPRLFLEKFERVSSAEDIVAIATGSSGGSAYLTGVTVDGVTSFLMFGGLKIVYLLISPVPPDWRGASDVVSFALDGLLYLIGIVLILRGVRRGGADEHGPRLRILLLALVGALIMFGLGTSAAGTAMRHRQKLIPAVAVCVALGLANRRDALGEDVPGLDTDADGRHHLGADPQLRHTVIMQES